MDIAQALFQVVIDLISFLFLLTRSQGKLAAENLFLRKQLAFYKERVSWSSDFDVGGGMTEKP